MTRITSTTFWRVAAVQQPLNDLWRPEHREARKAAHDANRASTAAFIAAKRSMKSLRTHDLPSEAAALKAQAELLRFFPELQTQVYEYAMLSL